MKKVHFFFAMLMATFVMCSFSSCSDDKDDISSSNSAIVGSWQQTNSAGTLITVKFNSNKTGAIKYVYPDGSGNSTENFEYDYREDDRYLTIIGSQLGGYYDVTITANKLRLYYIDDDYIEHFYEFTRIN